MTEVTYWRREVLDDGEVRWVPIDPPTATSQRSLAAG